MRAKSITDGMPPTPSGKPAAPPFFPPRVPGPAPLSLPPPTPVPAPRPIPFSEPGPPEDSPCFPLGSPTGAGGGGGASGPTTVGGTGNDGSGMLDGFILTICGVGNIRGGSPFDGGNGFCWPPPPPPPTAPLGTSAGGGSVLELSVRGTQIS